MDYIDQKVVLQNSHVVSDAGVQKAEPLKIELENFIRSVSDGVAPSVDGIEGKAILKIALRSCENGYSALL